MTILKTDIKPGDFGHAAIHNEIASRLFNIIDFGAVGDGVTDDTNAFKTAIATLTNGESLYLPPKTYLIKDTLTISDKQLSIVGDGGLVVAPGGIKSIIGSCLKWGGAENKSLIEIVDGKFCLLSGFGIDGNKATGIVACKLFTNTLQSTNNKLHRLSFINAETCISIGNEDSLSIEQTNIDDCFFAGEYKTGISITNNNTYITRISNPFFSGNTTTVECHIYCNPGHFYCDNGYFGLVKSGGKAIYINDGHAILMFPYSESHGVPFLVFASAMSGGGNVALFNPTLKQSNVSAESGNIIMEAVATLTVHGGFLTEYIRISNESSIVKTFGTQFKGFAGETTSGTSY